MNQTETKHNFVTIPNVVGEIDKDVLPAVKYARKSNRAQQCRTMLEMLNPGKATIFELQDKKEAQDYRSMLYTMAILKFGEAGRIGTTINDNLLYLWLV